METDGQALPPRAADARQAIHCPITFRSAWRPALGWVCVFATAWNYVFAPTLMAGAELFGHPIPVKLVQEDVLFELLATTLGIGGMRMIEKLKKVASG